MRLGVAATACAVLTVSGSLVAGCGSDDETATTTGTDGTAGTERTTKEPPALSLPAFTTPDGNIGCAMYLGYARCDIGERSWQPPPKPDSCGLDWGKGFELGGTGPARPVCAADTLVGSDVVLEHGTASKMGPVLCKSSEAGVRCSNLDTGHGFSLSRESYEIR
jgi:hypothetical protein